MLRRGEGDFIATLALKLRANHAKVLRVRVLDPIRVEETVRGPVRPEPTIIATYLNNHYVGDMMVGQDGWHREHTMDLPEGAVLGGVNLLTFISWRVSGSKAGNELGPSLSFVGFEETPPSASQSGRTQQTLQTRWETPYGLCYAIAGDSVKLDWGGPDAAGAATEYVVEIGEKAGSAEPKIAVIAGGSTEYETTLPAGTYYARVRRASATGQVGAPSNEVRFQIEELPYPPGDLRCSVSANVVTLNWQPPAKQTAITGYVVEFGARPGLSNLYQHEQPGTITRFALGLNPGTYYARVRAWNSRGTGDVSNEVMFVIR